MKTILRLMGLAGFGFAFVAVAAEPDPADCAGPKACRMCHKKADIGNQHKVWSEGPHAKAFTTLGEDKAKEIAKKQGIADPQASTKCLKCHATAYWFTEEIMTQKVKAEDGVTCESCHGPGKKFKKKAIMKKKEKAVELGLIDKPEEQCKLCHNDTSPTWDPEKYTLADGKKVGFDADLAYEKVKHPRPKK